MVNINRRAVAASGLAIVSLVGVFAGTWLWNFFGPGGFIAGKSVLADLQGLEVQHRNQRLQTPYVFGTYPNTGPVIVVATRDPRFPYAWIAATVLSCDDELCIVGGDASIDLACDDLVRLTARVVMAESVLKKLKSSCRSS